ncbi:MAG: glycine cleavage system aminomethyltransferase GcvT [Methanobacteriota archaeon]|nr:MAG: glycine cleavage system aminomethyltransferase GcvT [Euryarchaeota archaeon]
MKTTPLHEEHVISGARMMPFAGWDMPIQYTSVIEEHMAVREHCGAFDVSHMGDLLIRGAGARNLMERLMTNDVASAPVGRCVYSHILDEQGRIIDDTIVMTIAEDEFLVVPNAATTERVSGWIRKHIDGRELLDISDFVATIAVQGPSAAAVLERITSADLSRVRFFWGAFVMLDGVDWSRKPSGDLLKGRAYLGGEVRGVPALLSRTGYTGEDGFEIACENEAASTLWRALLDRGAEHGLRRAGLGARDTLRLEKGFLLSGTDFDGTQTPFQTGPTWVTKFNHDFIGREALEMQKGVGEYTVLVGMIMNGRGVPRHGYDVVSGSNVVGRVTSGTMSPVLRKGIALGYVPREYAQPGTNLQIRVRNDLVDAEVVSTPFIRREKK